MHLTIDTNILINGFEEHISTHLALLYAIASTRKSVCLDYGQHILNEYRKSLGGREMFEKWYKEVNVDARFSGRLSTRHTKTLTKLGCHEPSDHVFIAVAIEAPDRVLLTEDSDMGKGIKGQEATPKQILDYLTNTLQLRIFDASEALTFLGIQ